MSELEYQSADFIDRLRDAFDEMVLYKDLKKSNFISSFKLPSFMRDWVIKRFQDEDGEIDTDGASEFIKQFIPKKEEWKSILNRVVNFHETVKFLGKISVNINIKNQLVTFRLPDFGLEFKETIIPREVWDECCDELLKSEENWGIIEIGYYMPEDEKDPGKIKLVSYQDFCPYEVSLEDYKSANEDFSLPEWVDIILSAVDYNPEGYESFEQKLTRAEYNKLYIMFLSDKYKLSGKDLFSAIEREHEQLEKLREGGMSDSDIDSLTDNAPADKDKATLYEDSPRTLFDEDL